MSLALRPHHLLCIGFFQGKGYSEDFVRHMTEIIGQLHAEDPPVQLVSCCDELCAHCPHNCGGICRTGEKTARYDAAVLRLCSLREGDCLRWTTLRSLVQQRILAPGRLAEVCADCQWYGICSREK